MSAITNNKFTFQSFAPAEEVPISQQMVKQLFSRGIGVNSGDRTGSTVLERLAAEGHPLILKLLYPYDKVRHGEAFFQAVESGDLERATECFDSLRVDVNLMNSNGETALHLAARSGHAGIVKSLLDRGMDVNAMDRDRATALHLAVRHNRVNIVELLLNRGADVHAKNQHGATALLLALESAREEIVFLLLAKGAQIPESFLRGHAYRKNIYDKALVRLRNEMNCLNHSLLLSDLMDIVLDYATMPLPPRAQAHKDGDPPKQAS